MLLLTMRLVDVEGRRWGCIVPEPLALSDIPSGVTTPQRLTPLRSQVTTFDTSDVGGNGVESPALPSQLTFLLKGLTVAQNGLAGSHSSSFMSVDGLPGPWIASPAVGDQ